MGAEEQQNIPTESIRVFGNALLSDPLSDLSVEIAEIPLDLLFEKGSVLEEIPILKLALAVFRTGKGIKERFELKKQLVFLQKLSRCEVNADAKEKRRRAYENNERWFYEELEHIAVYISRLDSTHKASILAECYADFVDGAITRAQFEEYLGITDRLFLGDSDTLLEHYEAARNSANTAQSNDNSWRPQGNSSICNRLSSLGLLVPLYGMRFGLAPNSYYDITDSGKYYAELLSRVFPKRP